LFAPNGLGPCQEIRSRRRSGWHHLGDDLVLLRHLHLFPGGNPAQNLRPLLRQLLNTGGFHSGKMPRNAPRRKLAFVHRLPRTGFHNLRQAEAAIRLWIKPAKEDGLEIPQPRGRLVYT
jgi:hypothetical protein